MKLKFNYDTLTTVVGGVMAAGTAAQPIVAAVDGSFKQADWVKLVLAVFFAIQGWATNRTEKVEPTDDK